MLPPPMTFKLKEISVVAATHGVDLLVVQVVELQGQEDWKAAAHCADHFRSSMTSRTQPREREGRAGAKEEEGGR